MTNREKYEEVFRQAFEVSGEVEGLQYQAVTGWDSVGHMQLMAALEDAFAIEMEIDDIIDFSSFLKGTEILAKYGVMI